MALTPGELEDRPIQELLTELIREFKLLRLAGVRKGILADLGDLSELEALIDSSQMEGD